MTLRANSHNKAPSGTSPRYTIIFDPPDAELFDKALGDKALAELKELGELETPDARNSTGS